MLYVCFGTFVRGIIVNAILLVPAGVLFALLNLFGIPFSILGTTIFIGIIFLLILGFFVIMMWAGGIPLKKLYLESMRRIFLSMILRSLKIKKYTKFAETKK